MRRVGVPFALSFGSKRAAMQAQAMTGRSVISILGHIGGWIARLILVLFVIFTVEIWLDVLVFQPEEYERLIGSEAACGKARNYCSWQAFALDTVPHFVLSILAVVTMVWRSLPRREVVLCLLASAVCGYLGWRVYNSYLSAMS